MGAAQQGEHVPQSQVGIDKARVRGKRPFEQDLALVELLFFRAYSNGRAWRQRGSPHRALHVRARITFVLGRGKEKN